MLIGGIALGLVLGLAAGRQDRAARGRSASASCRCCSSRSSSGSGRSWPSGWASRSPRRCASRSWPRLRAAAVHALAQPLVPGPRARAVGVAANAHRDHGQRRLHAGLGCPRSSRRASSRRSTPSSTSRSRPARAEFLLQLGPLGDIIPLPFPPFQNVASIGDLFLTAGLGFFLFATLLRTPADSQQALDEAREGHLLGVSGTARLRAPGAHPAGAGPAATVPPSTGLSPALEETAALQRPLSFGSSGTGLASPALSVLPEATLEGAAATTAVTAFSHNDSHACTPETAPARYAHPIHLTVTPPLLPTP